MIKTERDYIVEPPELSVETPEGRVVIHPQETASWKIIEPDQETPGGRVVYDHPPGACCKDCEHARIWRQGGEDLYITTAVFCDLHQEDFSVTDPACSFWERRKIEKNAESAE